MELRVVRSSKRHEERFAEKTKLVLGTSYNTKNGIIAVNSSMMYQEHLGFGGAFTEAAAFTLSEMSEEKRAEAIRAYFDKETGLGYNLGRVHIHSCDFALGNYTYVEEGDMDLSTFDLSHEEKWVIPLIKDAAKVAGHDMTLLASPWSPPGYMKNTGEMNYGGTLREDCKQLWADYYVKFIQEMEKRNVPIWAVSVQNEPAAVQCWDSCIYTSEMERDFVKSYLGPTLHANKLADKHIIVWDHNRDVLVERGATVLADPEANKYVWGVGNHWYLSEDFNNLAVIKTMFPDKHLLFTEGCVELTTTADGVKDSSYIGLWENGERYGRNIIGDFNNFSEGFIDWNLVLNEIGGPNHVHNYCEAPIIANRNTGELTYNPSYYFIGHFSKFIQPGARRIELKHNAGDSVHATAFKNPNGEIVIVTQNEGWIAPLSLVIDGRGVDITLPDRSITTYILSVN